MPRIYCGQLAILKSKLSISISASDVQAELEREMAADEGMPTVKHYQQREYAGMFEYRKEDEPLLVRNLIIGKASLELRWLFCV